jgi:hypothetical protein
MTEPSTPAPPPRPLRAQPVAWATAEALAANAQALAKGWLLLLLERAPLESLGAIPAAELAAEGPAVCAALARALGSDAELARLAPEGELAPLVRRIGPLTAAGDAAAVVTSVEALRACLLAAALERADAREDAGVVAALAERVAAVAATAAATAVAGATLEPLAAGHDETREAEAEGGASLAELPHAMDDGDLWISTLERHVDRCQREGGGLALLRVELADGERLVASASPEERGVPYGRLAQAIRRAIRRQDLVASDHQGRAWVIAPAVGRAGAIALAERIGAGVEHGEHWRGAPLAATIGFAVYGEDGRDAATLIERAEEAMLAASAAGMRIGEAIPSGDGADRPGPRLVR